ncbi:MAG: phosphoglycolate phosphatase [Alteromonadaceae bacterium]|nr:MAG: phosphoglycolate phosphatase [Alteromonadaceae bacterium]
MSLRAVFFDLDGTLLDTAPDLGGALNRLLDVKGKTRIADDIVRNEVSNGAYALIELGFGAKIGDQKTEALRQELLDIYTANIAVLTTAFPGIKNLIEKLASENILWGIATNKPWVYTEPLLKHFQFASEPQCVICPEHVKTRKPDPESLYLACEQAGCSIAEAVYIGDHERDIQCGQRAEMTTIAASYGYIADKNLVLQWGADYCVSSADEIWPILKTL